MLALDLVNSLQNTSTGTDKSLGLAWQRMQPVVAAWGEAEELKLTSH